MPSPIKYLLQFRSLQSLNIQNHCEKPIFFCFSDRSYRNSKSHEIGGHLAAILRVLELIFLLASDQSKALKLTRCPTLLYAFFRPTMTSKHPSCRLTSDGGVRATKTDWEIVRRKQKCGDRRLIPYLTNKNRIRLFP